ncbi:hypothetical protein [Variovorax sp. V15]|uniref:hypothetical protein n=1 Tax=Variovorax sp. V15 TaxID=3065952 RepID=UPI0034E8606A
MTSKRASEKALAELHAKLAEVLKEGLAFKDEDGKPNPALLNVARQFLKDNKIEAEAPKGSPLGELMELPVFDDELLGTATPAH